MINGLHVDVPSAELKGLLLGRLKYHQDRTGIYEKQLEQMRATDQAIQADAEAIGKTSNASPIASIEQAIKKHKDNAIYFKFMVEHIVVDETYRLTDEDLYRLGVKAERY